MKKLGILLLACITALNLWADEEFKIGKLTFDIETPTTVRLTDADEDITKVFLSETIDYKGNSYTLTYIGGYAFKGCESLTSVTIPNSVTSIGYKAFKGTALYNDPTNWENGALYIDNCLIEANNSFVGHFRIKENTRVIADSAFYDCTSLTSVTIPNSVTEIGWNAFGGTALYENPANWENGALYIDDCLIKVDEGFAGHFRIKENTRVIADNAFGYCTSLTSVIIPNSETSIGEGAFSDCSSLTSVTIPNSVTSIGRSAFWGCSSLTSVSIPNSVTWIGNYAFDGCKSLTSVTIPNSVTWIGNHAFWGCSSLTSVSIPNSVTWIGNHAFAWCKSLTSVTIPNSVTSIGDEAFLGCTSLTSVTIPNSVTSIGWGAFAWCSSLTSVTIPKGVTSIGEYAFNDCTSLTSVTIPNSVTSIGGYAFEECTSLTSITIPNSVTSIGGYAFEECTSLTSITIPNSVTSIGGEAFKGTALYNDPANWENGALYIDNCLIEVAEGFAGHFRIKENTRVIAGGAFEYCTSLTSVTIPNSVTSIGNRAFYGCESLTSVTIPNSVTSIGEEAFAWCSSLTSVTIPNSVTSIGGYAFPEHTKIIRQ